MARTTLTLFQFHFERFLIIDHAIVLLKVACLDIGQLQ